MAKYKINPSFILETIDEQITLFDSEHSFLYKLNELGSYVLLEILNGKNEDNIANAIRKKYDSNIVSVKKDITYILDELKKNKIIVFVK